MTDPKEAVEIRFKIDLSLYLTLGAYSGPITKEIIAENVYHMFVNDYRQCDIAELIDKYEIDGVYINYNEIATNYEQPTT